MRKKVGLFIIVILIVIMVITSSIFFILKPNKLFKENLENANISANIRSLNLNLTDDSLRGFAIQENFLYYLEQIDYNEMNTSFNYNLIKLNMDNSEKSTIKSVKDTEAYCYLRDNIIDCKDDGKVIYYDLNFEKILENTMGEYGENNFIPYKGEYINFAEGILYINQDKIKIPNYHDDLYYMDYFATESNTYLLLNDARKNTCFIYDISNNKMINTNDINYIKYANGFYFYTSTYYHIFDLQNNKEEKYNFANVVHLGETYKGAIRNDLLYQHGEESSKIEVLNLKKEKISEIDISNFIKGNVQDFFIQDDKLFITDYFPDEKAKYKNEIYVIDLKKLNLEFKNIYDYFNDKNIELEEKINNLKAEYNVNIKIKDATKVYFPDFSSEVIADNSVIDKSLRAIENILKKFPQNFFDNFYSQNNEGLNIYISGKLTPSDYETQAANPVAYSLMFNSQYAIVLDATNLTLEETFCHEIMHNLENNLNNRNIDNFTKWDDLNPTNFYYNNSYTGSSKFNYTPYNNNKNKVYFLTDYSYTFSGEDRAEIFGKMCSNDSNEELKEYPNLYKKAQAIKEELIRNYPELKNSVVLKNY